MKVLFWSLDLKRQERNNNPANVEGTKENNNWEKSFNITYHPFLSLLSEPITPPSKEN